MSKLKLSGIGKRICEVREQLSVPKFAEINNVHKSTVVRYEKEDSYPDARFIIELCNRFDIGPNWLLTGEGPKHTVPAPTGFSLAMNELRSKVNYIRSPTSHRYRSYIGRTSDFGTYKNRLTSDQLDDFLRGKYLPTNDELKDLCEFSRYNYELVKLERSPSSAAEGEDMLIQSVVGNNIQVTGRDSLKNVLEIIERLSHEMDVRLPFDKKAELTTLLYEDIVLNNLQKDNLPDRAQKMLNLIL